jgi:DNA-binding transcriptional regulator GbsR (MarR family)
MFEQVIQPLTLFLLLIIALYSIALVVFFKKTARFIVITSTIVGNAQRDSEQSAQQKDQQSQTEETPSNIKINPKRQCL